MKHILWILLLVVTSITATAQVGVGTANPNSSAALDVTSTSQGFLPPRLTTSERDGITTPAEGLLIYNRTSKWVEFFNGTDWISMIDGSITTSGPAIGDTTEGGMIAYIFQSGDPGYVVGETHGLIVTLSDIGVAPWGCMGTVISGADGTALGTGAQNTIDIENGCTSAGTAADLCANYANTDTGTGVYNDWFLPSKDELNKLYAMHQLALGSFSETNYWSSTEYPGYSTGGFAWNQDFSSGTQINGNGKANAFNVRAVRYF